MARQIKIELVVDANGAVRGVRSVDGALVQLDRQLDATARSAGAFSGIVKNALGVGLGNILSGLVGQLQQLGTQGIQFVITQGAKLEEIQSKFEAVFGASSKSVDKFVNNFANKAGLTRATAKEYLGSTGAILTGAGYTKEAAATVGVSIFKLAADMQSFNNKPIIQALEAVNDSLLGDNERLKAFGIALNETDIQQKAFAQTGKKVADSLTKQEKAAAALALITERMKRSGAFGDLEKTFKSTANQARYLSASSKDLADEFARVLAPSMKLVLVKLIELAQDENFKGFVANIAAGLATTIEGLTNFIADILGIWREYGDEIVTTAKLFGVLTVAVVAYQVTVKRAIIAQAIFTGATRLAAGAMRLFNLVIKLNPIGLLVAALVAAGTALYIFRDRAAGVGAVVAKTFAVMIRAIGGAARYIFNFTQSIPQTTDPILGAMTAGIRGLGSGFGWAADQAGSFANTLDGLSTSLNNYKNDVQRTNGTVSSFAQFKNQFYNTISAGEKALVGETEAMSAQSDVAKDLAKTTGDLTKAADDRTAANAKATEADKNAVGSIARLNEEVSELNKQYEKTADAIKRQNIQAQIRDKKTQLQQIEAEAELTAGSIALFEERKRVYADQFKNAGTQEERARVQALIDTQDEHIKRIYEQIEQQTKVQRLRRDASTFTSLKEIEEETRWIDELIQAEQQGSATFIQLTNRVQALNDQKRILEQPLKIAELQTALSNADAIIARFNKEGQISVDEIEDSMRRLEEGIKIEVDPKQKEKITATISNLKGIQSVMEKPIESKKFEIALQNVGAFVDSLATKTPTIAEVNEQLSEVQRLIELAPSDAVRLQLVAYADGLERMKGAIEKPIDAAAAKKAVEDAEAFFKDVSAQTLASLNDLDELEENLSNALGTVTTEKARDQIIRLIEEFSILRSEMQSLESVGERVFGRGFKRNQERIERYGQVAADVFGEVANLVKSKATEKLNAEKDTIQKQTEAQKSAINTNADSEKKKVEALQNAGRLNEAQAKAQLERIEALQKTELESADQAAKQKEAIAYEGAKKQFELGQKFAVAQALISGSLAVVNALATVPFVPAGIVAAVSATAATAFQIAKIKAEKFAIGGTVGKKKHEVLTDGAAVENGTIRGGIRGKDSVLIMAQEGEEIINASAANEQRPVLKAINAGMKPDEVLDVFIASNKLKMPKGKEFPKFADGGTIQRYYKYAMSQLASQRTAIPTPNLRFVNGSNQNVRIDLEPLRSEINALRSDMQKGKINATVNTNVSVDVQGELRGRGDDLALSVRKSESRQKQLGRGLR